MVERHPRESENIAGTMARAAINITAGGGLIYYAASSDVLRPTGSGVFVLLGAAAIATGADWARIGVRDHLRARRRPDEPADTGDDDPSADPGGNL